MLCRCSFRSETQGRGVSAGHAESPHPGPIPGPSLPTGVESCCYPHFLSPPPPPPSCWLRAYSRAASQGPEDASDPWAMSQYTVQAQYSLSTSRTIVPPNDKAGNSDLRCHSQACEALLLGGLWDDPDQEQNKTQALPSTASGLVEQSSTPPGRNNTDEIKDVL